MCINDWGYCIVGGHIFCYFNFWSHYYFLNFVIIINYCVLREIEKKKSYVLMKFRDWWKSCLCKQNGKYVRIYLVILNFINMKQNKNVEIVLLTLYFKPFWQILWMWNKSNILLSIVSLCTWKVYVPIVVLLPFLM